MSIAIHRTAYDPADHRPAPRRYAWSVFAIIFALMVVDYVDRQVVVSMFPHLKAQWDLSDRELGALVSIVSITVALGAVPLSFLADRWSRVKSIFLMAMVWSLATIGAGFAGSYAQLMGARSVVGLGEAAYGTVGMALLASLFPPRMRSTVLGAFLAAGMFGSVLGVMLGGFIADRWGWQAGFGAVGIPGLFLALVFLLVVRDYKTVALPSVSGSNAKPRMTARAVIAELLRPRTALITCIGAGLNLLVVSTMYSWLPSYFNRFYGLAPDQAGLKTAIVVLIGGVGALLWSTVADRLSGLMPRARLIVPAIAAVATTALMMAAFAGLPAGAGAVCPDRRRSPRHGRKRRPDRCGRHRRHPPGAARDGSLDPVADAQSVRPRRRSAAHRGAFRRLRLAVRNVSGPAVRPARRCAVHGRGAHLRS
jgi:predicted MFS family arabinose efflux permease